MSSIVFGGPQNSQLNKALFPDEASWTLEAMLLAEIADSTKFAAWTKTKDASKSSGKPPEPIPRPGVEAKSKKVTDTSEKSLMTFEEARAFMGAVTEK